MVKEHHYVGVQKVRDADESNRCDLPIMWGGGIRRIAAPGKSERPPIRVLSIPNEKQASVTFGQILKLLLSGVLVLILFTILYHLASTEWHWISTPEPATSSAPQRQQ